MEKRTFSIIAAITVALLAAVSGLILVLAGGIPVLVSYMPSMQGAMLNAPGKFDASNLAMLQGCSCCLCIPIPLALGFFALHQKQVRHL